MVERFRRLGTTISRQSLAAPNVTAGAGSGLASLSSAFFEIQQGLDRERAFEDQERGRKEGAAAAANDILNDGTIVPKFTENDQGSIEFRRSFAAAQIRTYRSRLDTSMRSGLMDIETRFSNDPAGMASAADNFFNGLKEAVPAQFHAEFDATSQRMGASAISSAQTRARKRAKEEDEDVRKIQEETGRKFAFRNGAKLMEGGETARLAAADLLAQNAEFLRGVLGRMARAETPEGRTDARREYLAFESTMLQETMQGAFSAAPNKAQFLKDFKDGTIKLAFPVLDPDNPGRMRIAEVTPSLRLSEKDRKAAESYMSLRVESDKSAVNMIIGDVKTILSDGRLPAASMFRDLEAVLPRATTAQKVEVERLMQVRDAQDTLKGMPPVELQNTINRMTSRASQTSVSNMTLKAAQSIQARQTAAFKTADGAYQYGIETGIIQPPTGGPDNDKNVIRNAQHMSEFSGRTVIPFSPAAIDSITNTFNLGNTEEKFAIIQAIDGKGMPSDMLDETWKAISKKDPTISLIASLNRGLATEVMLGQEINENVPGGQPSKTDRDETNDAYSATVGTLFRADASGKSESALRAAADALYVKRAHEKHIASWNEELYTTGLKELIGATAEVNGAPIMIPKGMAPEVAVATLNGITDADLHDPARPLEGPYFRDTDGKITKITAEELKKMQPVSVAPGKYFFQVERRNGRETVIKQDGTAFILEMEDLEKRTPPKGRTQQIRDRERAARQRRIDSRAQ